MLSLFFLSLWYDYEEFLNVFNQFFKNIIEEFMQVYVDVSEPKTGSVYGVFLSKLSTLRLRANQPRLCKNDFILKPC